MIASAVAEGLQARGGGSSQAAGADAGAVAEPLAEWEQELLAGAAIDALRPPRPDRSSMSPSPPPPLPSRRAEMANYTAADVKRLRELTGSGMLACKNALAEADGDFDKAVEALRIKGAKDVGKRAERATAGLVAQPRAGADRAQLETDFVAKNAEFQALAEQVVDAALAAKAEVTSIPSRQPPSPADRGPRRSTRPSPSCPPRSARSGLRRVQFFDGSVEAYLQKRAADLPRCCLSM